MVQNWPRMTKIYLNDPKRLMNLIIGPFREPESDNFLWRDEGKEFSYITLERAWWFISTRIFNNTPNRYVNIM